MSYRPKQPSPTIKGGIGGHALALFLLVVVLEVCVGMAYLMGWRP